MTLHAFSAETSPSLVNLDANFGQLAALLAAITPSGANATLNGTVAVSGAESVSGNLAVGTTSGTARLTVVGPTYVDGAVGADIKAALGGDSLQVFATNAGVGWNSAKSALGVPRSASTSRSINASGTVNASGADYAEYMTKAGEFTIGKGDIVGIDAAGKLTNRFADAISFAVKSTDPAYVGGDLWGTAEGLGVQAPAPLTEDATPLERATFTTAQSRFDAALEAARQKVDRIAFAGRVPVNVAGASPGQFIIPMDDAGAIKGMAVSTPTLEQYLHCVGRVISVDGGRPTVIVKVA